jgi:hypothetical protein
MQFDSGVTYSHVTHCYMSPVASLAIASFTPMCIRKFPSSFQNEQFAIYYLLRS